MSIVICAFCKAGLQHPLIINWCWLVRWQVSVIPFAVAAFARLHKSAKFMNNCNSKLCFCL